MRIISPAELGHLKGVRFCNPYRIELEAAGKFPKRVKVGARRYGYIEAEIDRWIEERAAKRDAA
jgi:prophage regulatory protein